MRGVEVPLTRGMVAIIDEADAELVLAWKWHVGPFKKQGEGFYAVNFSIGAARPRRGTYLHRFIMQPSPTEIVDHINGDTLDCRRGNLRIGDASLNAINRRYANPTGYRGVHKTSSGKFRATLMVHGKAYRARPTVTAAEAARDYDALAATYHGAAAILNFPGERA